MASANGKVAIGMSGGVDSSVAAALLKEQGFDVCASTMVTYDGSEAAKEDQRHGCYGPGEAEDVAAAESVCKKLDIAFHVMAFYSTKTMQPKATLWMKKAMFWANTGALFILPSDNAEDWASHMAGRLM